MINAEGKRFVDEGADFYNYTYAKYGAEVLRQTGQYAYQVFDARVKPLLNTEYGFFVRDDNPLKFTQIADVKGYTVGVFGPSNTATALAKIKSDLGDLTIDMTPDDE